ncbi:hypothetical protein O181_051603 [Austropuccinia psidii MF-1]|uniref:Uncharacterized protein n=1 Tax=Austropuccinia psidii MF-1 TaxID=1389203 RepID=A0A9Q3E3Y9_9BASI|nr:hypothetical protein [Austropuccinia psidii MF-1]
MSPVNLRNLGFQRNQLEDREGLSTSRRPGRDHCGDSGGWQDTEGNHDHPAIHFPIKQEPQTRGLDRYGSSSSAPPNPQRFISMEHGQQEVQPGIPLGRTWSKLPEDLSQNNGLQRSYGNHQRLESPQAVQTPGGEGKQDKGESRNYPSYRRTAEPDRAYSDSFRLTSSRPDQLSSGFTQFINQQIICQESPFFTIPGSFQEETRIQGQKQDHLQPLEERVRPNDPETVGFGERSAQEPEVVVHTSRISSPLNRNITPTQIEHNVVTPESNPSSDALWLQMSQYDEQTQKKFSELEESHERMKILTPSMHKIVKKIQEGHAQLSRASEETNKIMNLFFEEQHHSKRDRDCLAQDINKQLNVYHSIKPQPQGHVHQGKSRVNRRRLTSRCTAVSIKSCFSHVSVTLKSLDLMGHVTSASRKRQSSHVSHENVTQSPNPFQHYSQCLGNFTSLASASPPNPPQCFACLRARTALQMRL